VVRSKGVFHWEGDGAYSLQGVDQVFELKKEEVEYKGDNRLLLIGRQVQKVR
jgi:hypothetical protein